MIPSHRPRLLTLVAIAVPPCSPNPPRPAQNRRNISIDRGVEKAHRREACPRRRHHARSGDARARPERQIYAAGRGPLSAFTDARSTRSRPRAAARHRQDASPTSATSGQLTAAVRRRSCTRCRRAILAREFRSRRPVFRHPHEPGTGRYPYGLKGEDIPLTARIPRSRLLRRVREAPVPRGRRATKRSVDMGGRARSTTRAWSALRTHLRSSSRGVQARRGGEIRLRDRAAGGAVAGGARSHPARLAPGGWPRGLRRARTAGATCGSREWPRARAVRPDAAAWSTFLARLPARALRHLPHARSNDGEPRSRSRGRARRAAAGSRWSRTRRACRWVIANRSPSQRDPSLTSPCRHGRALRGTAPRRVPSAPSSALRARHALLFVAPESRRPRPPLAAAAAVLATALGPAPRRLREKIVTPAPHRRPATPSLRPAQSNSCPPSGRTAH